MENVRAILLMIAAMAGFALEDMFIKSVAERLPAGQILIILGVGGGAIFALWARAQDHSVFTRTFVAPTVLLRNAGEAIGTMGFVLAITLTPLAEASAILQATPLAVTLGAALILGEAVGWRRWGAILVGFCGVLLIIRPGLDGFQPASLFAVQGVIGLAIRDIATRVVPKDIPTTQLSAYGFFMVVPVGFLMLAFQQPPAMPNAWESTQLGLGLIIGVVAYYAITAAMRIGDVAVVTPFRYTRLIFALIIGYFVFAETPDQTTLIGAAIIIASGLYTLYRERKAALARRRTLSTMGPPV